MSHLCYHNHHEVLLIYLVLLERRVIAQNFACSRTQNNENKRHVIHQPAALASESDSCQSSIKWCRCTNTLYRCISHHFRAKPARTNPYQLETAVQTRHTITPYHTQRQRWRTCVYQLLARHRKAVFSLFILDFFL